MTESYETTTSRNHSELLALLLPRRPALPRMALLIVIVVAIFVSLMLLVALILYLFYPALTSAWGNSVNQPILLVNRSPSSSTTAADAASAPAAFSPVLFHVSSYGRSYESNQQQQHEKQKQPQDTDPPPPPLLSVIIPAYNEEVRLPLMLQPALAYLSDPNGCKALQDLRRHHQDRNRSSSSSSSGATSPEVVVEWIVVSDGSTDNTEQVYRECCQRQPQPQSPSDDVDSDRRAGRIGRDATADAADSAARGDVFVAPTPTTITITMQWKFLALPRNQGKGGAVRAGMLASTGLYRLMVDADGATQFDHLSKLTSALLKNDDAGSEAASKNSAIVWGSRAHLQDSSEKRRQRSVARQLLMRSFHAFVKLICTRRNSPYIRDTQCGFKLFAKREALKLFSHLHLRGWAFDTELLILSSFLHIPIAEVPVNWHEVDGSKLSTSAINVLLVSASMLRDMICVRLCYELGIWTIQAGDEVGAGNQGGDESTLSSSMPKHATPASTIAGAADSTTIRSKSE